MKFSEKWLREWVSPPLDSAGLAECLTLAGLEVAAVEPVAPALDQVVVGEIVTAEPHPDADRLKVCQVDAGEAGRLSIVCGAANARAGLKVPVALAGAVLPGGIEIRRTRLRGVASAGMLCSATELGLAEAAEGLMVLDGDARPGMPLAEHLGLDDVSIDIELTPNRGDCLSIGGLAREVSALTGVRVRPPRMEPVAPAVGTRRGVRLAAAEDCPQYVGRVIRGIDARGRTPDWMQERLRRGGQRCVAPVVDVTNYVMLELGQPMHAFDLAALDGEIVVRHSVEGERLTLLDEREVTPPAGTLLIADQRRPLAIAGVMGGLDSAVGANTRDIFLESAYFRPQIIATRARALGLQTEASYRFERGVDPALQRLAVERVTALLLAIVGGRPGPVVTARAPRHLPRRSRVTLAHRRVEGLLGIRIPPREVARILTRLGMGLSQRTGGWRVQPPSHRFDIARECDLVEEVGRVYGYHRIPARPPLVHMGGGGPPEEHVPASRLRAALVDRDYQEAITYSFVDPALDRLIAPDREPLALSNPISSDMGAMRTSLWPGLLRAAAHNLNRQHRRVRLFEIGRVFTAEGREIRQDAMIGGVVTGPALPEQWGEATREADFFDLKGDVEALLACAGRDGEAEFRPVRDPALHPGQAAEILLGGRPVGRLGALHPRVQRAVDIDQQVLAFELALERLQNGNIPAFREISRFPAIRRDLAIVVDREVPAGRVRAVVEKAAGGALTKLELFDLYRGKGIDSTRKSLAFSLTLQDFSRTLTDEEITAIIGNVVAALRAKLGADLRN